MRSRVSEGRDIFLLLYIGFRSTIYYTHIYTVIRTIGIGLIIPKILILSKINPDEYSVTQSELYNVSFRFSLLLTIFKTLSAFGTKL